MFNPNLEESAEAQSVDDEVSAQRERASGRRAGSSILVAHSSPSRFRSDRFYRRVPWPVGV